MVTLLGPQRSRTTVGRTLDRLGLPGPVATVTAGWREREPDDAELDRAVAGRGVNLALYRRWRDVAERDPAYVAAARHRQEQVEEQLGIYGTRLHYAMQSVYEVQRRPAPDALREAAMADALEAVRALDRWQLGRVAELRGEFEAATNPADRPVVALHREAVAETLDRCTALVLAGGHVGILLGCLRLFAVNPAPELPVVAWSAGAMAISDRVVLFHDAAAQGPAYAEVYDRGLGWCPDVVPFPHARHRLRLDDASRMAVLARRFAPARCVVLDEGAVVDGTASPKAGSGARLIGVDGRVTTLAAA